MFGWFWRLFGSEGPEEPQHARELLLPMIDEILGREPWASPQERELFRVLDGLYSDGKAHALEDDLVELRERFERWYSEHPLEIGWGRDYQFTVVDPLGFTTEHTVTSSEVATLAPWATLLRSFVLETGGANVFHHGCDLGDLLELLHALHPTTRIEYLPLPVFQDYSDAHIGELLELLCHDDKFERLEHLAVGSSLTLSEGHIERLTEARWAGSLRTFDLTETMVDWSVDCPEQLHRVLPRLGAFESLTHLFMYNNVHTVADVAALLEASMPSLTHLNLGSIGDEPECLERLATAEAFPRLEELCLSGGPRGAGAQWDRLVEAPYAVYLHGRRVTAEYPKRP